jgi:hypothetical protein
MSTCATPAFNGPDAETVRAPHANHWSHFWTISDCIMHLEDAPAFFSLLDPAAIVGNIWTQMSLVQQSRLETAFMLYDIGTGRI